MTLARLALAASLTGIMLAETPTRLSEYGSAFDPAISPDGQSVVFASSRDGSGFLHLWSQPLAGGGAARQLTSGKQDDLEPAFSADGKTIAYRRGSDIYLIASVAPGKPRLFAASARRPRYSPDGRQIAYWTSTGLFVRESRGDRTRRLRAEFRSARDPVWSPDGQHLLFAGCRDSTVESCDWWVVREADDQAEPVATGAAKLFKPLHFAELPGPDCWLEGNRILFSGKSGENTSRVWILPLSPSSWRAEAAPRRLTKGERDERSPAAAPNGRILLVSRTQNIDVWLLPLDADAGRPKGVLTRVTSDAAIDQRPSLSRDGKRIAWETSRGGNFEVWVKDLASGQEKGLTNGPLREHMPALSPDGSSLVYDAHDGEKVTIYESAFGGGTPRPVREENVGQGSFQWTRAGDAVLYFHREAPGTVGLLNLKNGTRTVLLRHPRFNLSLADARLSPDGAWIAFPVPLAAHRLRLAIAPVAVTAISEEKDWVYLLPDTFNSSQPEWSPGGEWLYFLSDQSGRLGVWAQRVGAKDRKPVGAAKQVLAFPGIGFTIAEMRPRDIGLAVARDKLALAVAEYAGEIWSVVP